ncbi:SDR family NAD(P)-dependent oxidoreductase [Agrobacterium pusense]|uniref:SDR family NAD(P)-dependent oxidoreductase n=1 Tax=Agrobacterium pusense TaxID=648995 RepID=UPI00289A73B5|nr:SDR family oxidoreductase [Agrobacterium pusense]
MSVPELPHDILRPLAGRVALLTNADKGVGRATARLLAIAGADLALTVDASEFSSDFITELQRFGNRVITFDWPNDGSGVECARLARGVISAMGRIDVLIANAHHRAHWQIDDVDMDEDALEAQYSGTVMAIAALVRASVRFMGHGGRIIALSASLADRVGAPGLADYAATRAAITAFCRGAAHDLGPRGINVNVVQIGSIQAELSEASSEMLEAEKQSNVLKRLGTPEEVAQAILFLAGPNSSFITGSVLNVDGGYNA